MELGKLAGREFTLDEEAARIDIRGLSADSRRIEPGYLFAALAGTKSNGAQFITDALAKGAAAVHVKRHAELTQHDGRAVQPFGGRAAEESAAS